jgi:hypothetical protein
MLIEELREVEGPPNIFTFWKVGALKSEGFDEFTVKLTLNLSCKPTTFGASHLNTISCA